jgi:hypothetical protein
VRDFAPKGGEPECGFWKLQGSISQSFLERASCLASWSKQFSSIASAGLYSRHLGQVATVLIPEPEGRILEATRRAPTGGATHWCTRKLGAHLDVSHMVVASVWP